MSIDVLQAKIRKLKTPIMVGLDPVPELIPQDLLDAAFREKGNDLNGLANAYVRFCFDILEALKGLVPAVKVQSACFEALGHAGVAAMEEVLACAGRLKYYVLLETMRTDVGHIAEISAKSIFGGVRVGEQSFLPYPCDGIVLNGYLGSDGIRPYLPWLQGENPKNLFIVVKSSNRSSAEVQDLISGDRIIHTAMADLTLRWSTDLFGKCGYGEVGAVVGGLAPRAIQNLRKRYDTLFFLVPGYGAQGGVAKHAGYAFDRFGHGAIVSASRSILGAWRLEENAGLDHRSAAVAAVEKMKRQLETYVTVL